MSIQARLRQAGVGLAIAGLHLGGVLVWWATPHSMQLAPDKARLPAIAVWLPTPTVPYTPPKRGLAPPQDPTGALRPRASDKPSTPTDIPNVATAPNPGGMALPAATPDPREAQAPVAPEPTLNLSLSRKDIASVAPRSFAEQSPFRGRLPKTVERHIANAAAASGPWTEERIDNDRIRIRRGNTCVMMERPRAASIDPMNEAAARIPWRVGEPTECGD